MACYEHKEMEGVAFPDPLHCNVGKYLFAQNYHTMIKYAQEITGGIGGTCPSMADYESPELQEKLERYLCGRPGISTEDRIRVIKLVRDLTASCDAGGHMFGTIHGEGTLEAQRMMVLRDFDMGPAIALARKAAGLDR
jgi:4-hydroxybutyryl-CoA dehydratase/vinylacetyl-CoA-Delta-isomerase